MVRLHAIHQFSSEKSKTMNEAKLRIEDIELPKQVVQALDEAYTRGDHMAAGASSMPFQPQFWAKVALLALANEPVVPSDEDFMSISHSYQQSGKEVETVHRWPRYLIAEWQRRLFLRKSPEVPAEVKAILLYDANSIAQGNPQLTVKQINAKLLEAFEIGKRLGSAKGEER